MVVLHFTWLNWMLGLVDNLSENILYIQYTILFSVTLDTNIHNFATVCEALPKVKVKNQEVLKNFFHSEHEQSCQYAPMQCPNSILCPAVLKMVRF
jgi:hypothetical protein